MLMSSLKTELYPEAATHHSKTSGAYLKAKRAIINEWISGLTGAFLAMFICGHLILESSILLGKDAYQWTVHLLEVTIPIAKPIVIIITIIFFIHFVWASRKIPGKLEERKKMMELGKKIKGSKKLWNQDKNLETSLARHFETSLWIWQVRTGMIVLATGAFHLFLIVWNIFTDMGIFGQEPGLSAEIATSRVESGLWILYAVLMFAVVAHMAIGVYRLLVKWFADTWFVRKYSRIIFYFLFWFYIVLGIATTVGLAGPWEGILS